MRVMKVGDLKKLIEDVADDVVILTSASDHSYRLAFATVGTALYDGKGFTFCEDYGEDATPEADYGKRITAIIVS